VTTRYGLEIRAATGADAPGLSELLRTAGCGIAPRDLAARLDAAREAAGTVLVAVVWGPPSGIIALHRYPTLMSDRPTAQITLLLVGSEDRRKGIGRLLVKAAAQAARNAGCGALELTTASADPSLLAFCKASGFTEAGARLERSLRKVA
jgi:GNAT superfamily N-acetyltransferase